ncbi:efflux RND transporter periplasmic adaptor subunit [Salinimonas chungwhensis]|uniref:efflux RND transporter periplasmic adaptor subunit n=1 Tax=Salinimonas chungwhensis TaxID=265425 RepID=UPI00037AE490|nr:efflux RND transporter periplasmic adaptor subunit [Salinimonas chungwhensis]
MKKSSVVKTLLPVIIIAAAVVVLVVLVMSKQPPEKKTAETKAFLVDTRQVNRESVNFEVQTQGNVLPKNQTQISAQVSGRVASLSEVFVAGGMFQKGDVLVTLEPQDYETELKLAEAEMAQAQAALAEEVARGEVARQEWRSVNTEAPPELGLRKPQLASQKANVKAAEAKLERAQRNLERTRIRAPYNGLVVSRNIDIGQFVSMGTQIGTLYSTDVAEIRLPVADSDMAFIDLQQGLREQENVILQARVNGIRHQWRADLVRSEGILDSASRVSYVVASVEDPYNRDDQSEQDMPLRFGQFVQASISAGQPRQLFVLPRSVLRLDQTVLTVNADNELEINPVDVARTDAEHVYIAEGLNEGDQVVISAVPNPFSGMKVRLASETDTPPEESSDAPDSSDDVKLGAQANE